MTPYDLLAAAIESAHAVGPDTWALSALEDGTVRLAVGHRALAIIRADDLLMLADPQSDTPDHLDPRRAKHVPLAIAAIDEDTVDRARRLAARLARAPIHTEKEWPHPVRTSFRGAHDANALLDLEAKVARALPRPSYDGPTTPLGVGDPEEVAFASPPALAACVAILDAVRDTTVRVNERSVRVQVLRRTPAPLPTGGVEGLTDISTWPSGVDIRASWEGGSADLRLEVGLWQRTGHLRHRIGLRLMVTPPGLPTREVVWCTLGAGFDSPTSTREIPGNAYLHVSDSDPNPGWSKQLSVHLRDLVAHSGLPMSSGWKVRMLTVSAPDGAPLPSPDAAVLNYVTTGLYKLPFLLRHEAATLLGAPLLDLESVSSGPLIEPLPSLLAVSPVTSRLSALSAVPGGNRNYADTTRALLRLIDADGGTVSESDLLEDLQESHGAGPLYAQHVLTTLVTLELVAVEAQHYRLTPFGEAQLASADDDSLFDSLVAHYTGFIELLVLLRDRGPASSESLRDPLNRFLRNEWRKTVQVDRRIAWLLSLGLAERTPKGAVLTDLGRDALSRHADEAAAASAGFDVVSPPPSREAVPQAVAAVVADDDARDAERLVLTADLVRPWLDGLRLPDGFLDRACAALTSGKHLLLTGPPGTGKTQAAGVLAKAANQEKYTSGLRSVTAHADWTTADTVGGYLPTEGGGIAFHPGAFLQAVQADQWLLIDELNRADVDQAFGELMTVLSGATVQTPYKVDGVPVTIGREATGPFRIPPTFRLIATMNTWDKTSLFRLSYAFQRRFAVLNLGVPEPATYRELVSCWCDDTSAPTPPLAPTARHALLKLFSPDGLLAYRELGPALAEDIVGYTRTRLAPQRDATDADALGALAEALELFLLPQLEGLDAENGRGAAAALDTVLAGAAPNALSGLRTRLKEILPHAFGKTW